MMGGKVFAPPWVRLGSRTVRAGEEPEEQKRHVRKLHVPPSH